MIISSQNSNEHIFGSKRRRKILYAVIKLLIYLIIVYLMYFYKILPNQFGSSSFKWAALFTINVLRLFIFILLIVDIGFSLHSKYIIINTNTKNLSIRHYLIFIKISEIDIPFSSISDVFLNNSKDSKYYFSLKVVTSSTINKNITLFNYLKIIDKNQNSQIQELKNLIESLVIKRNDLEGSFTSSSRFHSWERDKNFAIKIFGTIMIIGFSGMILSAILGTILYIFIMIFYTNIFITKSVTILNITVLQLTNFAIFLQIGLMGWIFNKIIKNIDVKNFNFYSRKEFIKFFTIYEDKEKEPFYKWIIFFCPLIIGLVIVDYLILFSLGPFLLPS